MTSEWQGKTLKDIRDKLVMNVCTRDDADITKSSNFLMSSLKDAQLTPKGHTGSQEDPYLVDVDIERLAARIDIMPNACVQANKSTYTYNYNVTDASNNVIGGFVLESVMPYNDLTSGEYLIKRVTDGNDKTTVNYNLKETEDANHNSTNYVICPWTISRTGVAYRNEKKSITDWESMSFPDFYKVKNAKKVMGEIMIMQKPQLRIILDTIFSTMSWRILPLIILQKHQRDWCLRELIMMLLNGRLVQPKIKLVVFSVNLKQEL